MLGIDTGCITTMDKNQWIGKAHDQPYALPIKADIQFAALACGARSCTDRNLAAPPTPRK